MTDEAEFQQELEVMRALGVPGGSTDRPAGYVPQMPFDQHPQHGPSEPPAAIQQPATGPRTANQVAPGGARF